MTKDPILPVWELLNELVELDRQNERPLGPELLIKALLEIDWDSDEGRIAMELYEEIVAKGLASPPHINSALDRYMDALARGEAKKMTRYEWLKTTFVDPTRFYPPDLSQESWFTDERSAGSILQCNEFVGMSEYLTRPKREQEASANATTGTISCQTIRPGHFL